jgi:hypothetical protein
VKEITGTMAHLMSLPLPDDLRERLSDVLLECVNQKAEGAGHDRPEMVRAWMPGFIRQQEKAS